MVHEHLKGLQVDRRVLRRRGWISPEDLERELSALPDAADKIDPGTPETERPEGGAAGGDPDR